jgi:hypothetical protein
MTRRLLSRTLLPGAIAMAQDTVMIVTRMAQGTYG